MESMRTTYRRNRSSNREGPLLLHTPRPPHGSSLSLLKTEPLENTLPSHSPAIPFGNHLFIFGRPGSKLSQATQSWRLLTWGTTFSFIPFLPSHPVSPIQQQHQRIILTSTIILPLYSCQIPHGPYLCISPSLGAPSLLGPKYHVSVVNGTSI